jgi:hypothetical protein
MHHSDHRCQYTSLAFGGRCREAGVQPSVGNVADAFDCDDLEQLLVWASYCIDLASSPGVDLSARQAA